MTDKSDEPKKILSEKPGRDGPYSYNPKPKLSELAVSGNRKSPKVQEISAEGRKVAHTGHSPRLRRFLELVAAGKGLGEAKKLAGWAPSTKTNYLLARAKKLGFGELLDKAGLTDEYLTEMLAKGVEAVKKVPLGRGEWVEDVDWTNRHRCLETVLATKGHLVKGYTPPSMQVNAVFVGIQPAGVKDMLAGAFALMARSAGVEVDESALKAEIDAMSAKVLGGADGGLISDEYSDMQEVEAEIVEEMEREEAEGVDEVAVEDTD